MFTAFSVTCRTASVVIDMAGVGVGVSFSDLGIMQCTDLDALFTQWLGGWEISGKTSWCGDHEILNCHAGGVTLDYEQ